MAKGTGFLAASSLGENVKAHGKEPRSTEGKTAEARKKEADRRSLKRGFSQEETTSCHHHAMCPRKCLANS